MIFDPKGFELESSSRHERAFDTLFSLIMASEVNSSKLKYAVKGLIIRKNWN